MWELKEETCEVFKSRDNHLRFKEPLNVIYDDGCHENLMLLYMFNKECILNMHNGRRDTLAPFGSWHILSLLTPTRISSINQTNVYRFWGTYVTTFFDNPLVNQFPWIVIHVNNIWKLCYNGFIWLNHILSFCGLS